jgi:hypothetical protein
MNYTIIDQRLSLSNRAYCLKDRIPKILSLHLSKVKSSIVMQNV